MVRFSVPNSYTNYRPNKLPLLVVVNRWIKNFILYCKCIWESGIEALRPAPVHQFYVYVYVYLWPGAKLKTTLTTNTNPNRHRRPVLTLMLGYSNNYLRPIVVVWIWNAKPDLYPTSNPIIHGTGERDIPYRRANIVVSGADSRVGVIGWAELIAELICDTMLNGWSIWLIQLQQSADTADHQLLADLLMADLERVSLCGWSTEKMGW